MVAEPAAAAAVGQQEQAIQAMSRLLNALLDISKLESGAVKPEPADFTVASLFGGLRRDFASAATSKGLTLKVDECVACVHSDPSLVEQILRNLVSNAIKYTREGCVRLRCLREQARVRIEVRDTGIGIPADQIGYIYDEFYQVGVATNASRDGYGLGLCIVQRLVRLLDLRLEVRSEVGKGSAFSLVLPPAGGPTIPGVRRFGAVSRTPYAGRRIPRLAGGGRRRRARCDLHAAEGGGLPCNCGRLARAGAARSARMRTPGSSGHRLSPQRGRDGDPGHCDVARELGIRP